MLIQLPPNEASFLLNLFLCILFASIIGSERELRGKPAGISTHSFVIGGSMIFAFISSIADPESKTRIAAQIVSGIGFLGAGIILKNGSGKISNLTTAASLWFSASIGMAIGFNYHILATLAALYAVIVARIPHVGILRKNHHIRIKFKRKKNGPDRI